RVGPYVHEQTRPLQQCQEDAHRLRFVAQQTLPAQLESDAVLARLAVGVQPQPAIARPAHAHASEKRQTVQRRRWQQRRHRTQGPAAKSLEQRRHSLAESRRGTHGNPSAGIAPSAAHRLQCRKSQARVTPSLTGFFLALAPAPTLTLLLCTVNSRRRSDSL